MMLIDSYEPPFSHAHSQFSNVLFVVFNVVILTVIRQKAFGNVNII